MPSVVIENPVLNSPYEEPNRHFYFDEAGITDKIVDSRRLSSYFIPIPKPKKKGKQLEFETEWTKDRVEENKFINDIRNAVNKWRAARYDGVTKTTRQLLGYWQRPEREKRLYFCQIEALEGALHSLYTNYKGYYRLWEQDSCARVRGQTPPVFIVVCNNTNVSKLVFDYIAGWERELPDGSTVLVPGKLDLFGNVQDRRWSARPNTILVDSEQLESGEAMSEEFRRAAAHEIEEFKEEFRARFPERDLKKITDEDLFREVMNTVGKPGKLGEQVKCVVSVSMLTEGWDANTVTHILGVRAFGTQLLCEQVVGRGLAECLLETYFRDQDGNFKPWLFPQLLTITKRWMDQCLACKDDTFPQMLLWVQFALEAASRIYRSLVDATTGEKVLNPILYPYDAEGSTRYVDFDTTQPVYATRADRCHISHVVAHTGSWEQKLAQTLESLDEVISYFKNHNVGFCIPYTLKGEEHSYLPDFVARVNTGGGAVNLILEVTGERRAEKEAKVATARTLWVPALNNHGGFGRWAFLEIRDPWDAKIAIRAFLDNEFGERK